MRKIIVTLLSALVLLTTGSVSAAGNNKILVAYFSCTNNTKTLAQNIASALDGDLYEIRPAVPYSRADLDWNNESSRSTIEMRDQKSRPALADKNANVAKYQTIIIAYPIWWSDAPRVVYTFVESYDFSGKTVIPVCTSGGSDIGSSGRYLQAVSSRNAVWKAGRLFSRNASKDEITRWFNSVK